MLMFQKHYSLAGEAPFKTCADEKAVCHLRDCNSA